MKITWLGHSCFLLENDSMKIVTDPFDPKIGFSLPAGLTANYVTVSHNHYDHNNIGAIQGNPTLINKPGNYQFRDLKIKGIDSFHDADNGLVRGANVIFVIEIEGKKVCHLGDLGNLLNQEQLDRIGRVDALLFPAGGTYTIDPAEAKTVIGQLSPRIAIPMHYKTEHLAIELALLDDLKMALGTDPRLRFLNIGANIEL